MDKNRNNDDFQFRPLTEGLGFHKKTVDLKEDVVSSFPTSTGILPRPKNVAAKPLVPGWTPSLPKAKITESQRPAVAPSPQLMEIPAHWAASLFDGSMVLGLMLIFSAIVFALTQIGLGDLVEMLSADFGAQLAVGIMLFAILEIYGVACRCFFGRTLGEWVFDLKLGTPAEQDELIYPVLVAWRIVLVAATGFALLPALSMALGRDVTGLLSGLCLYSEKE